MPSWREVEAAVPELAAAARELFDAHVHKTLATVRRDGSPRISGTEVQFTGGELCFGSMWMAVKALDLRRDPRFALHSGSASPPDWTGDAKVAGLAVELTPAGAEPGSERSHLFRADVRELVVVHLGEAGDRLVIDSWHPGRGQSRRER